MKQECPIEVFLFVGKRIAKNTCSGNWDQKKVSFGAQKDPEESVIVAWLLHWKKLFAVSLPLHCLQQCLNLDLWVGRAA